MIVEVLPLDFCLSSESCQFPCKIEYDRLGLLVVTSLQRLRNPLVRYFTGDIGSVHMLSAPALAKIGVDADHLRILRLQGRDIQRSFQWEGEYFDFSSLKNKLSTPSFGILRWQIVISVDPSDPNSEYLEVRVLRRNGEGVVAKRELMENLKEYFCVHAMNERLFCVTEVDDTERFVRSESGNKVIAFVDRRKTKH